MRKLHESENHISITEWLNENLNDDKSIIPHLNTIPNLNSKGIYFWFMKTDGYKELSKFISINPIEPRFTKIIDKIQYDLVYLGTAGTGKKGNSNLAERFEWHINQAHTASNVCHGTLSTLRAGLGALLSDDLIIPDTENLVNSFMKNYMKVYWIEYSDDKLLIDNDEKILIKVLRPLLNIKNNPNAKANAPANSTKFYKIRRAVVYKSTRLRLGCKGESEKIREKNNPNDNTPIYNYQIINDNYENCVEYFVLQNQHIGEVTRGIEGLPLGKSKIAIYDSSNPNFEFTEWTRVTGNNNNYNAQNIYKYFDNTSSSGLRRFIVIQNWMIENDIVEITVKVCPVVNDNLDKIKNNASPKTPLANKEDKKKIKDNEIANKKIEECLKNLDWDKLKDKNKPKLLIIGCSNSKTQGGNSEIEFNYFNNDNYPNLNESRTIRNTLHYENLILNTPSYFENINRGNADYFNTQYNFPLYKSAIDRYAGGKFYTEEHLQLYRQKNVESNLHILIISGLYGVLDFRDSIIDYHLKIEKMPFWTKRNNTSINDAVKKYIKENHIDNESVFYSLSISGDYSYKNALKPIINWKNLWITHDRGDTSARLLKDHFLSEL
jgi:hypothetical protein